MQSSRQDTNLLLFLSVHQSSAMTQSASLLLNAWVLHFTFSWTPPNVHVDDNMNQWVILLVWTCRRPKVLKGAGRPIDLHQAFKFPWKQKVIIYYRYLIHLIKLLIKSYCHSSVFHSDTWQINTNVELSKIEIYVIGYFFICQFLVPQVSSAVVYNCHSTKQFSWMTCYKTAVWPMTKYFSNLTYDILVLENIVSYHWFTMDEEL